MAPFLTVLTALLSATSSSPEWRISYDNGFCTANRDAATRYDGSEVISISQDIIFGTVRATISSRASGPDGQPKGQPTFDTGTGPTPFSRSYYSSKRMPDGQFLVEVILSRETSGAATIADLGLRTKNGQKKVSNDGLATAQLLLNTCREQHLNALGVNPAEVDPTLTPAVVSPVQSTWFDANDLPKTRVKSRVYEPFVIWRVDSDGRASRCQFVTSSGQPELDDAICRSFMQRVRYVKSAVDKAGRPAVSWQGRRIKIRY